MTTAIAPPAPGSPEWARIITASKVPAITGSSPWQSPFGMWHTLKGNVEHEVLANKAMERGNYLEDGILQWWSDQHPEYTEVIAQHYAQPEPWCGATLDALASGPGAPTVAVEVKTASSSDGWGEEQTDAIPPYYRDQVDFQMAMEPRATGAWVAVLLGPRMHFAEYFVERDQARIEDLMWQVYLFYSSLSDDTPPPLDDSVATLDTLQALHPDIDRDDERQITPELAVGFAQTKAEAEDAEARHRLMRSELLDVMAQARLAKVGETVIARRQPNRYGVSLVLTPQGKEFAATGN